MKLKRVSRLDSMPLTAAYFTPEGYLRDKPIVTTCGIFEYQNDDGSIRRELRLPEDVFDPESLKTYKGKPIIFTHEAGDITKDNVSREIIGTVLSEGIQDGTNVRAEIIIHDSKVLKAGLRELSLGYDCDCDETPGVWQGQPYDAIQHNIRINHLAIVEQARAGHKARLNLDGKSKGGKKEMRSKKTRFDAADLTPEQLDAAVAMYLAAQEANEDEDDNPDPVEQIRKNADRRDEDISSVDPSEIPAMQEDIKTLLSEVDRLNGVNDMTADEDDTPDKPDDQKTDEDDDPENPEKQNQDDDDVDPENQKEDGDDTEAQAEDTSLKMDSVERNWSEMYSICQMANQLGFGAGFVPRSVMDGKKQIINAVNPKMKLDGKSREYVNGAYQVAVQQAMNRKTVAANMRKVLGKKDGGRMDSSNDVSGAYSARQKMINKMTKKGE